MPEATQTTQGTTQGTTEAGKPAAGTTPEAGKGTTGTAEGTQQASLLGAAPTEEQKKTEGSGEGAKPGAEAQNGTDLKLTVPEGTDEATFKEFLGIAQKHGLKAESAQEVVNFAAKAINTHIQGLEKQIKDNWSATTKKWVEEAKADKEFGGANFASNVAIAVKAVRQFGGDDLVKVLNETGLGNHPAVIRAFIKAGKAISEDTISGTTGSTAQGQPSERARLQSQFPNSPEMWQHLPA